MPFPVSNIREVCKERKTSLAEIERTLKIGNGVAQSDIKRYQDAIGDFYKKGDKKGDEISQAAK